MTPEKRSGTAPASKQTPTDPFPDKSNAELLADTGPGTAEFPRAEPPKPSRAKAKTYRARIGMYVRGQYVKAGGLFVASPESGPAKSVYAEVVEDAERPPADVVKAIEEAEAQVKAEIAAEAPAELGPDEG